MNGVYLFYATSQLFAGEQIVPQNKREDYYALAKKLGEREENKEKVMLGLCITVIISRKYI